MDGIKPMRITLNLKGLELDIYKSLVSQSLMRTMPDSVSAKVFLVMGMEKFQAECIAVQPVPAGQGVLPLLAAKPKTKARRKGK